MSNDFIQKVEEIILGKVSSSRLYNPMLGKPEELTFHRKDIQEAVEAINTLFLEHEKLIREEERKRIADFFQLVSKEATPLPPDSKKWCCEKCAFPFNGSLCPRCPCHSEKLICGNCECRNSPEQDLECKVSRCPCHSEKGCCEKCRDYEHPHAIRPTCGNVNCPCHLKSEEKGV